jgi:hypothetical protein
MIAIIASHALLELDVGEVSNQLSENSSTGIHPPLFRRYPVRSFSPFRPFSVQIVFGANASYSIDATELIEIQKVLYRTLVR